jgi:hypothetical protein
MKFKQFIKDISEQDYREVPAFNYSTLKALDDNGPMILIEREEIKGIALEFGTLVDILITNPENRYNVFYTKPIEKPTASLLILADSLLSDLVLGYTREEILDNKYILNKIKELGIWVKAKEDTLIEKFNNDLFYNYINASIEAKGKIICSPSLVEAAEHCANVLLSHPYTKDLFIETDDIEVLKQVPIFYNFKKYLGKGKIDLLRINHKEKIISLYDIKTGTELPSNFMNSFYFFKYYLQVISYLAGINYMITTIPELKDYKIDKFRFIYISKKLPNTPCIYEVGEELLSIFFDGWTNSDGKRIKGFNQLVDEYIYYKTNDIYDTEKETIDNNGIFNIKLL